MNSNSDLHVVHIITRLDPGGAQKVCLLLLDGIQRQGGKASLISGSTGELVALAKKFDSVFLLKSLKHSIGLRSTLSDLKSFFQIIFLLRSLKKKSPNLIVHTHTPKAGILGRFAAFFAGVGKRVHTIHGLSFNKYQIWPVRIAIKTVEWFASLVTTHFICVSRADYNICQHLYPRFEKKSSIIYPAVDWRSFIPARRADNFVGEVLQKKDKEQIKIGSISCFKPLKNLIDLFGAFKNVVVYIENKKNGSDKIVPRIELTLEVVGDGKLRPQLENWIMENGMESKIKLLGWKHNIQDLMTRWDIFAMTSLKEGLPCAVVEARFATLPVVAYAVGGIPEIIIHGKNGLLAKPHDLKSFTSNLSKLVLSNELRQKISTCSEDLSTFHDEAMCKKHLDLYTRLF